MKVVFEQSTAWAIISSVKAPDLHKLANSTYTHRVLSGPSLNSGLQSMHRSTNGMPINLRLGGLRHDVVFEPPFPKSGKRNDLLDEGVVQAGLFVATNKHGGWFMKEAWIWGYQMRSSFQSFPVFHRPCIHFDVAFLQPRQKVPGHGLVEVTIDMFRIPSGRREEESLTDGGHEVELGLGWIENSVVEGVLKGRKTVASDADDWFFPHHWRPLLE
mmetsp:Transcript_16112/g.39460  ORF Transcript_16112/g.39460 Transcript_16112/m.39460 type:complete len:215 (-) Transcript_16112:1229-1873(-)